MKRNKLHNSYRLAVSMAIILAVLLSGFSFVIVGFVSAEPDSEPTAFCKVIFPTEDGSMNKSEPFNDEHTFFLTVPAVIGGTNVDHIKPSLKDLKFTKFNKEKICRFVKLTTTASISSKKAMEFTLVGAKPSGTG